MPIFFGRYFYLWNPLTITAVMIMKSLLDKIIRLMSFWFLARSESMASVYSQGEGRWVLGVVFNYSLFNLWVWVHYTARIV
jgi:hypothetical protein